MGLDGISRQVDSTAEYCKSANKRIGVLCDFSAVDPVRLEFDWESENTPDSSPVDTAQELHPDYVPSAKTKALNGAA
jgi:hypothetical protein